MTELDTRRIASEEEPTTQVKPEGTLPPGTVLQERYKVLAVQGVGGMGAVYRSQDLRFAAVEKIIAVKEMVNAAPDPRLRRISVQNFEREANILAGLSHAAIPKIFDYFTDGDRSYLALEFVMGETLETLLERNRQPLGQEDAVDWALQVCDVLAYLHNHKPPVIFRDIKPGNLMLRADGRVMVIDFGIAKVFEYGQRGTMIGTEGYSPPEQYRGVAEPRGDLYALGATLHHLLTGRDPRLEPPFTFHERPIRMFNQEVTPELEAVVMKALSYDVQDRFASVNEMAQAMAGALPRSTRMTGRLDTSGLGTSSFRMAQEVQPRWVFKCEDEVRSSPRCADGMIYIGSYDYNLYAIDAEEGKFVWKFPTEGGIVSTPCIHRDTILIGSEDGNLYALERNAGKPKWRFETGDRVRSSARVEYGHAFFGSDDGCLYAVNVQTGRMIWKFQSAGPIRSTPLAANEMIFAGSDDGYLYAVEMRSGHAKWKYNTNRRVTSSATLGDDMIYVGSADGHLYAFRPRSSWPAWSFRTKGYVFSTPMAIGETVYVGSADGGLYAIDAETGRQRWRYDATSPITSSPAVTDEVVYIGANDGALHAIDVKRGHGMWQYFTGGPIPSSPVVFGKTVYFGSTDHSVYALPT